MVASLRNYCNLKNSLQNFFRVYESSIIVSNVISNVIYRPANGNFLLFMQEIESLIIESVINEAEVIYLGDFNIRIDVIKKN